MDLTHYAHSTLDTFSSSLLRHFDHYALSRAKGQVSERDTAVINLGHYLYRTPDAQLNPQIISDVLLAMDDLTDSELRLLITKAPATFSADSLVALCEHSGARTRLRLMLLQMATNGAAALCDILGREGEQGLADDLLQEFRKHVGESHRIVLQLFDSHPAFGDVRHYAHLLDDIEAHTHHDPALRNVVLSLVPTWDKDSVSLLATSRGILTAV